MAPATMPPSRSRSSDSAKIFDHFCDAAVQMLNGALIDLRLSASTLSAPPDHGSN